MNTDKITVQTTVKAPMTQVWEYYNDPAHITKWAFADNSWEAPSAENNLKVGGRFKTVMAAKDKSASFDFTGTYTAVKEHELIEYDMDGEDHRHVKVEFAETPEGVTAVPLSARGNPTGFTPRASSLRVNGSRPRSRPSSRRTSQASPGRTNAPQSLPSSDGARQPAFLPDPPSGCR